ncbi:MAG: gamma carbonic anhydrase family protein [Neisseriaceae bacterium]|nr:gamma carbonic anhydrase family protein [Neisseriaceae bacterium]
MRQLSTYLDTQPIIGKDVYLDESARISGDVVIGDNSSIWFHVSIRGDVNYIRIGKRTNIQDNCVLHVGNKGYDNQEQHDGAPLIIGDDVTVGHAAILHGCTIGNRVLIGMGSIILDKAVIDDDCIIGAGSLVPPNKHLESGYLYLGSPIRQVRKLSDEEIAQLRQSAHHYVKIAQNYALTQ